MTVVTVIDAFFRVFNFGIFAALVGYYLWKTLIPSIKATILREQATRNDVAAQRLEAQARYLNMQNKIGSQDLLFQRLDEKVDLWRKKAAHEHELKRKASAGFKQELNARIQRQRQSSLLQALAQRVLPQAFNEAADDLKDIFKDSKRVQEYNQRALDLMGRVK
jgi:hypothetical protein